MGWWWFEEKCQAELVFEKAFCYHLAAMAKAKKLKTYEDYLAQIPKSWDEPLREIHAIRWMHYDQEKKMTAKERVKLINQEAWKTIEEFRLKPASVI